MDQHHHQEFRSFRAPGWLSQVSTQLLILTQVMITWSWKLALCWALCWAWSVLGIFYLCPSLSLAVSLSLSKIKQRKKREFRSFFSVSLGACGGYSRWVTQYSSQEPFPCFLYFRGWKEKKSVSQTLFPWRVFIWKSVLSSHWVTTPLLLSFFLLWLFWHGHVV